MDPLTILGGVQTAFSLASTLKNYVDDAKGAKDDLQGLASKIESTYTDVSELKSLLAVDERTPNWNEWGRTRAKQCVEQSNFMLQKLGRLLLKNGVAIGPDTSKSDINPTIFSSMLWPFFKRELGDLQTELMLLKVDINSALTTWKSGPESVPGMKRLAGERLQKYKTEREILMRRLLDAKSLRLEREKDEDEDSDDSRQHISTRRPRVSREERHLFQQWEDAIAEKLIAEQKVQEAKLKETQEKEDEIRRQYVQSKFDEAKQRANAAMATQRKISEQLQSYSIPPSERDHLVSAIFEKIQPTNEDDQFIRAAFPNGTFLNTSKSEALTSSVQPLASNRRYLISPKLYGLDTDSVARRWLIFGKRKATSKNEADTLPEMLRDPNAPGGIAVLSAVYFDEDPFGVFHGVKLATTPQATHQWMKKHGFNVENVSVNFRVLPENCKDAILDRLKKMSSWSPDYTWRILLVHMENADSRSSMLSYRNVAKMGDQRTGAYVIFKRQLRPARLFRTVPYGEGQAVGGEGDEAEPEDVDRDDDSEDPASQVRPIRNASGTAGPSLRPPNSNRGFPGARQSLHQFPDDRGAQDNGISRNAPFSGYRDSHYSKTSAHDSTPVQNQSLSIRKRPTYAKIHRKYIDLETLKFYDLPWEWDQNDPNFIIITHELSELDTDALFEHTRRLRELRESREPFEPHERIDALNRPRNGPILKPERRFTAARDSQQPRDKAYGRSVRFADDALVNESDLQRKEQTIKDLEEKISRRGSESRVESNIYTDRYEDRPVHVRKWSNDGPSNSLSVRREPLETHVRSSKRKISKASSKSSTRAKRQLLARQEAEESVQDELSDLKREKALLKRERQAILEDSKMGQRHTQNSKDPSGSSDEKEEHQNEEEDKRIIGTIEERLGAIAEEMKLWRDAKNALRIAPAIQQLRDRQKEKTKLPLHRKRGHTISESASTGQEVEILDGFEPRKVRYQKSRPISLRMEGSYDDSQTVPRRKFSDNEEIIEVDDITSSDDSDTTSYHSYESNSVESPTIVDRSEIIEEMRENSGKARKRSGGRSKPREVLSESRSSVAQRSTNQGRRYIFDQEILESPTSLSRRSTIAEDDIAQETETALDDAYGEFLVDQWTSENLTAAKDDPHPQSLNSQEQQPTDRTDTGNENHLKVGSNEGGPAAAKIENPQSPTTNGHVGKDEQTDGAKSDHLVSKTNQQFLSTDESQTLAGKQDSRPSAALPKEPRFPSSTGIDD